LFTTLDTCNFDYFSFRFEVNCKGYLLFFW